MDGGTEDDDDDCQFVEHSNINEKAMLAAHIGAVSLPLDNPQKAQTEKKKKR